jgi:hypothetical protein
VSAIDRLRDIVATHSNAEAILWSRAEFVAVLQEIDELQGYKARATDRDLWLSRALDAEKRLTFVGMERNAYRDEAVRRLRQIDEQAETIRRYQVIAGPLPEDLDPDDPFTKLDIQGVEETFEWSDDVHVDVKVELTDHITVTPEQLVRIVKEAGKS